MLRTVVSLGKFSFPSGRASVSAKVNAKGKDIESFCKDFSQKQLKGRILAGDNEPEQSSMIDRLEVFGPFDTKCVTYDDVKKIFSVNLNFERGSVSADSLLDEFADSDCFVEVETIGEKPEKGKVSSPEPAADELFDGIESESEVEVVDADQELESVYKAKKAETEATESKLPRKVVKKAPKKKAATKKKAAKKTVSKKAEPKPSDHWSSQPVEVLGKLKAELSLNPARIAILHRAKIDTISDLMEVIEGEHDEYKSLSGMSGFSQPVSVTRTIDALKEYLSLAHPEYELDVKEPAYN